MVLVGSRGRSGGWDGGNTTVLERIIQFYRTKYLKAFVKSQQHIVRLYVTYHMYALAHTYIDLDRQTERKRAKIYTNRTRDRDKVEGEE